MLIESEELKTFLLDIVTNFKPVSKCDVACIEELKVVLEKITELEQKQQEECRHALDLNEDGTATCDKCGHTGEVLIEPNYMGIIT